jgi:hypothetical protein
MRWLLLAQEAPPSTMWQHLANEDVLSYVVGALAIVVTGIVIIVISFIRHRERMAMIERGMHPEDPHSKRPPKMTG